MRISSNSLTSARLMAAIATVAATWLNFSPTAVAEKGEAAGVHGRDCNFEKGELTTLGDPATGTKTWEIRRVPMIPDMRRLLERIKSEREDFTGGLAIRARRFTARTRRRPR